MKKIAIFVEGQTERVFVRRLLSAIADRREIHFEEVQAHGARHERASSFEWIAASNPRQGYYILLWDCGAVSKVRSDLLDRYQGLVRAGFQRAIGVRDAHPVSREQMPSLRANLNGIIPGPVPVDFILAVMEVEAWFIAEHTHFARVDHRLTMKLIHRSLGIDPSRDNPENLDRPSHDLHDIYSLVGLDYSKSAEDIERTASKLDFHRIRRKHTGHVIADLDRLVDILDDFFSG